MSVADDKLEDLDFEALEQAVRQSPKGNWFLDEYARRLRSGETTNILEAIAKLERVITSNVPAPALANPEAPIQAKQLRYFRQDEELFVEQQPAPALTLVEPSPAPAAIEAVPAPVQPEDPPAEAKSPAAEQRGARLKILRIEQPAVVTTDLPAGGDAEAPRSAPNAQLSVQPADDMPARKQRIIITRQAAAEDITIPLLEDGPQSAG